MTRQGAASFIEDFPGGLVLRGRNLLGIERVFTAVRVATLATSAAVCLAAAPVPDPPLAEGVFAAGCAYVLLSPLLIHPQYRLLGNVRSGVLVIVDMLLILAAAVATGGGRSPLLPLLFLGVVSAPPRLNAPAAFLTTAVYTVGWAMLAEPYQRPMAAFVALCGVLLTLLTTFVRKVHTGQVRDPLTDCSGRQQALFFMEHLLTTRSLPFAVVLLDLDGFKQINDRFGHATGDEALQALAKIIGGGVRTNDLLARLGGDEFLMVLPGMDGTAALAVAERIRDSVDGTPLALTSVKARPRLSCSAGVTEAAEGDTIATLLSRADRHLYQAKQGRNQVLLAAASPADVPASRT